MTGGPAEGPKGRALSIQSRDTQLPEVVQWGLRFAAGLSILVNIEVRCWLASARG
jgi:hypothetical protein